MKRMLLAVVLLGLSSVSFAAFMNGHQLQSYMSACDKYRAGEETGDYYRECGIAKSYVGAGFDTAQFLVERWLIEKRFCKPDDVDRNQLVDTVKKYMLDHPEQLKFSAAGIIFDALTQAYPCE